MAATSRLSLVARYRLARLVWVGVGSYVGVVAGLAIAHPGMVAATTYGSFLLWCYVAWCLVRAILSRTRIVAPSLASALAAVDGRQAVTAAPSDPADPSVDGAQEEEDKWTA